MLGERQVRRVTLVIAAISFVIVHEENSLFLGFSGIKTPISTVKTVF
jgi:hypothetical protein